jgi:pyruvate,orthophosphate dikinase
MKPLLGGKGANLAEMSRIGLPVPPGFTITTEVCTYYYQNKKTYPKTLDPQVKNGVAFIEKIMGTKFGDKSAMPLLVSVRSGARDSMPGMMDTILNLGLNDDTVLAWSRPPTTSALPGTATAASSRCRRRCHGCPEAVPTRT